MLFTCLQVETQVELQPKWWTVYIDSCNVHKMLLCSFWGTLIIANLRCGYLGSNSILNVTLEMVKLLINAMETFRMHIQLELSHRCPIPIISCSAHSHLSFGPEEEQTSGENC